MKRFVVTLFALFMISYISAENKKEHFYRGIYITNPTWKKSKKFFRIINKAKRRNINTLVIDVQPTIPDKKLVNKIKSLGFYTVARVVVFLYGFNRYPIPESLIKKRINTALGAAKNGFDEIQFDYIRFEDSNRLKHVSLKERYRVVEGFLKRARNALKKYGVRIGADVFGRVTLNRNDMIGQRLEGIAKYVDVIYPMLYPSHYTWSKFYMSHPYETVYRCSVKALRRVGDKVKIVAFIQGFPMKIRLAKMSLKDYIIAQLKAVYDAKISGFIVWNARQEYDATFRALKEFYKIDE